MRRAIPIAIISLSLAGTAALGGSKVTTMFTVDTAGRYASGQLGDVRADPDPNAWLRCDAASWSDSSSIAYCVACNSTDCAWTWSTNPEVIDTVRSLGSNDQVFIRWFPSGELELAYLLRGSHYTPLQP